MDGGRRDISRGMNERATWKCTASINHFGRAGPIRLFAAASTTMGQRAPSDLFSLETALAPCSTDFES